MISATWEKAVRNVQMVLLYHLRKHQEQVNKTAKHVLKVTVQMLM